MSHDANITFEKCHAECATITLITFACSGRNWQAFECKTGQTFLIIIIVQSETNVRLYGGADKGGSFMINKT